MHFIPAASMHFPFPTMFIIFFFLSGIFSSIHTLVCYINRETRQSKLLVAAPPCTTVWSCAHRETMCRLTVYVRLT